MKILQIHNEYQFKGGEDNVVEAERRLLLSEGNEVFSLIAHNKSIKKVISKRRNFYSDLENIVSNNLIDVAHIHNVYQIIGNDVYRFLTLKNIPIVQTLHNFRFLCPAGLFIDSNHQICERCIQGNFTPCFTKKCYQNSYVKSYLMKELVRGGRAEVLKNVDAFIALNEFYKSKYVESGFLAEKIFIKPNFIVDHSVNCVIHEDYALFMGRISPEKGIEVLINAFKGVKFKLKIAGTGDEIYISELIESSKNNSNIEFLGFTDGEKKKNLLKKASFLVVPSIWYENFPISILEASANGKPVIASNIGGLPFIVKDKETGLLFKAGDANDLRNAINVMLNNDHFIALGKNAYEYYKENFTEKQNYQQLIEIYESAIAAKKLKNDQPKTHNH